jgi:excisionase family DNA binding protein
MKQRTTQLGVRKNPDSPRVHGLRLSANSPSALLSDIEDSQGRELTKDEPFSSQSKVSSREPKQIQFKGDAGFEPLLDASEAASLLRIHPKTLQKLARIGYLPAYRVGKFWRYRASDLEKWLRSDANSDRQLADCVDFTQEKNQ